MVEQICGVSAGGVPRGLRRLDGATPAGSAPPRWSTAVGWTQHSVGVQYIRTGAIIQLLLGNMGRPGGGIMALRGHASIQGSTDIPTLFNLLPGYLPMPHAQRRTRPGRTGSTRIRHPDRRASGPTPSAYAVSLLKAYWGEAATAENDFCFDYLPRITGDHGTYRTVLDMIDGKVKGYFLLGQNPAVGSAHGRPQRLGMANLDWLVVRDLFDDRERDVLEELARRSRPARSCPRSAAPRCSCCPAASHVEKEGTFTQTQRMLQWREKAVEPPGDCRSELWFFYHLGRLIRERLADSDRRARPAAPRPDLGLPDARAARRAQRRGRAHGDQRLRGRATARPLSAFTEMKDDGSTLGGCWIYTGVYADGVNQAARRKPGQRAELGGARVGLGLAGQPAHPLQPRLRRPGRASRGASARPTSGGTTERAASGPGHDVPDFEKTKPPSYRPPEDASGAEALAGDDPFIMQGDGKGWLFVPQGLIDGPLPTHYEPVESPFRNPLYGQQANPTRKVYAAPGQPDQPEPAGAAQRGLPVRVHHQPADRAPHGGRHEPDLQYLSELQPEMFVEVSPRAGRRARASSTLGWATWSPAAAAIEARVLVTDRLTPLRVEDRIVHQVWLPYHWGSGGLVTGDSANDLFGDRRSTRTC